MLKFLNWPALALLLILAAACANNAAATPPVPASPPLPTTPAAVDAAVPATTPPAADLVPLIQLAVGQKDQCGLQADGQVNCQGGDRLTWWHQPPPAAYRQVTVGQDYACGRRQDGTIACWGATTYDKDVPPAGQFTWVSAGKQHTCALDTAGLAQCWGWNENGRATPPAGIAFATIAAGGVHSCGLTAAGALQCWGKNDLGQAANHNGPFQSLALGVWNTCALRPEGAAWCQGDNAAGQSNPPPGAFTHIAAGSDYACGLRPGGRPECWGGGFGPDLGEPAGTFTAISAGWDTFCALTPAGFPLCWRYQPGSATPQLLPELTFRAPAATAIQQPVELLPWPGGGLAVAQRSGSIVLCRPDNQSPCAAGLLPPLLDLTDRVDFVASESGLLSAALDPDFDRFPFLYVYYTTRAAPRKARLSRFPVVNGRADPSGEMVILELPMPNLYHFGGSIRFGADDLLYLGLGDNGIREDPQNLSRLRGKIIRIDVRGAAPEQPYSIPADNPMRARPGARPEIWAYGLRNPWRMSFDAAGRLWVGDVGHKGAEEISIVTAGANLGWPVFEGNLCFSGQAECAALTDATPPVFTYTLDDGNCAIIWGGQYQGAALPQLAGAYVFGDFCSGRVWALAADESGGWARRLLTDTNQYLGSFGFDAAGEMYLLPFTAPILTLEKALTRPAE